KVRAQISASVTSAQSADLRSGRGHRAFPWNQVDRCLYHRSWFVLIGGLMLRNELKIALHFTVLTTVMLGILYPLAVTAIAQLTLPRQANGDLIEANGQVIGSRIIGQSFTGDRYFHGRPSSAGNGYDATSSGPSNLAPTSQKLISRIEGDVKSYATEGAGRAVPIDLVTASGS